MEIVVVQLDVVWENKAANHAEVREFLAATDVPAQSLIILPEMFDTGFSMNPAATAQSESRESEQLLQELASTYDCAVLGGVVGPLDGSQATNEAVAFAPNGSELVRYQKMQPFTLSGEQLHYPSGDHFAQFQWDDMQVAPFICYDLRFPELFRPAAQAGAELICVIASWPELRSEHWVRLLQARAIENQAFVVGVNRCGSDPQLSYDGRSVAFDPMGSPIFELDGREQVRRCELDPSQARQWREAFPALHDIRPSIL